MSDPSAIEVATRRLQQALEALEVAVERRLDAAREEDKLATLINKKSAKADVNKDTDDGPASTSAHGTATYDRNARSIYLEVFASENRRREK